jgi:hypothetical protein
MLTHGRIESEIVSAALGGPRKPPVDLSLVAGDIGVGDIRPTEFRDGFTDFSLGAPIIYLNNEDSGTRMRFVFAHELAHVMVRLPRVVRLIQMRGQASLLTDEEELADRIGATILIPDSWVEALSQTRRSLGQLRGIAQLADVSLATLVARMASSKIDVALLQWRRGNCTWHVIDRPGVPPSLQAYVKPSITGRRVLEDLGREESDVVVDCRVNGSHVRIGGKAYRRGRHVLQYIAPSRDIWIVPQGHRAQDGTDLDAVGQGVTELAVDRISAQRELRPSVMLQHNSRHGVPTARAAVPLQSPSHAV